VLKKFQLATLKFETAGHSMGQAHDMQLTGIIDAHEFRNKIIARRDALRHGAHAPSASAVAAGEDQTALMRAMLAKLDEIAVLLRERR
jgi:putative membrane protein